MALSWVVPPKQTGLGVAVASTLRILAKVKEPILVFQPDPMLDRYSVEYQKVVSSVGSTVIVL